jgi:hypothetical protein
MSTAEMGTDPKIQGTVALRPKWRTPMMTEDAIGDATLATTNTPGSDGNDGSPGYSTTGPS